jgi:hypothetical protein
LLAPAFLLLTSLALAIPGSLSPQPEPNVDRVASTPMLREVEELRELADGGSCRLVSAVTEADPVSAGFVGIMLRLTEALDRVTRDATAFMAWMENVMTRDSLDALDVVVEGVAGWFAGSFDSPSCMDAAPESAEIPVTACRT